MFFKHVVYVSGNGGILAEQYQHLLDLAAMLVAYGDLATSLCDRCIFAVGYESADKFFFRRG